MSVVACDDEDCGISGEEDGIEVNDALQNMCDAYAASLQTSPARLAHSSAVKVTECDQAEESDAADSEDVDRHAEHRPGFELSG